MLEFNFKETLKSSTADYVLQILDPNTNRHGKRFKDWTEMKDTMDIKIQTKVLDPAARKSCAMEQLRRLQLLKANQPKKRANSSRRNIKLKRNKSSTRLNRLHSFEVKKLFKGRSFNLKSRNIENNLGKLTKQLQTMNLKDKNKTPNQISKAVPKSFNQKYKVLDLLDKGSNSKVYLCREIATGLVYAVKQISYKNLLKKNQISNLNNEVAVLKALKRNKYTCQLHKVIRGRSHVYLVMSYEGKQNLKSFLSHNQDLTVSLSP